MQYILSQEELDSLVPKKRLEKANAKIELLNNLVLEISKYPCIHSENKGYGCCDDCPLSGHDTCRLSKIYSK